MKQIISIGITLFFIITQAQDFQLGIRGGLSLPTLTDNSNNIYSENFKSLNRDSYALTAEYHISPKISFVGEALFAGDGGERSEMQPIPGQFLEGNPLISQLPPGSILYANFKNKSKLRYLEIPLMVRYNFIKQDKLRIFVNGGIYAGFLLKAEQETSGNSELYMSLNNQLLPLSSIVGSPTPIIGSFDATTDVKDDIKTFNSGFHGGVGMGYKLGKSELQLEVRGAYGLIPIQKDKTYGESKIGNITISFGYAYTF